MGGEDVRLIVTIIAAIISAIALTFTIINFIYARFGDRAKAIQTLTDVESRLTATEKDFQLFIGQTLPEIRRERDAQLDQIERELLRRLTHIEGQIVSIPEMATKIDLFWGFVRENFPKMLLHHNELARDALLMKLSSNTIKHAEAIDLKAILENEFEHLEDKKSTEALINRLTLLSLEAVLKEHRA